LIDGYNLIHHWPELRKVLAEEGGEVARGRLAALVRVLHDVEQVRVSLVFDGRGSELTIERPSQQLTFSFLFSPAGLPADDVIEQLVAQAKVPADVLVATADQREMETIRALGAEGLSPESLQAWIDRVGREQTARLAERRRSVDKAWKRRDHK
jgi:predicted RNA-binding protein with PIN domain